MEAFDYVIVGAGSAGCVLAARLTEQPDVSVLLLEAGHEDSHVTLRMPVAFLKAVVNPAFNWGYLSEPEPHLNGRRLWLPRGRRLFGHRTQPQTALTGAERLPGDALESDASLDAFIRDTANLAMHPVGTCAMGQGADAVVDSELRVIGVEGLRVVDASVMPTVPGANTNASTIMIGEKAADLIRGRCLPRAEL